jgi:hypothetical protein
MSARHMRICAPQSAVSEKKKKVEEAHRFTAGKFVRVVDVDAGAATAVPR